MFALVTPLLLGLLSGIFTGLIPGIHINLIATTFLILIPATLFPITSILIFITSMAITHTFIDFIPSIFLGAPDDDTTLGVLPGHELLLKGQGHYALKLTLIGSTLAILSLIFIIPIFIFTVPKIYPFLQKMMGFFLIWASILLISQDKQKTKAIMTFLLAGFLGMSTLNLNINQPILPLLTGLFGASTIIHSIKSKTNIPPQIIEKNKFTKKELVKPALATIIVSPICSLLPGLGSSQAAIIGSKITGKLNREQFLILLGSINTLVISISFITLFLIQKSRTGVAAAMSQITQLTNTNLTTILITILITSILIIPITLQISKLFAKNIHKISYTKISVILIIFLTTIITIFSGFLGLLVFVISTTLGLTCIEFKTNKSLLMGCLLIPTIIFYLPF